ncbi:uncharacterized protein LOC129595785 [Paramacrobiotus metropolitanus]|uniref:uncharacterized protein LOC129595785 n=1 Tax=Paramacrobiotus metropolitanus TaxID=2943436 RepID=UPI0024464321|nr:uncharacterized protein LOC129595785 [Paramacrobiotus metropolitanus]
MYRNICRRTRVDVLGDDDVFRTGRVVDVTKDGLVIDFFCPDQRRRYIPFDRIFLNIKPLKEKDLADAYASIKPGTTIPVEVLMPETPAGPWVWFRAEIVNVARLIHHNAYRVAVVQWVQDGTHTDVVPLERLRWRVPNDWRVSFGQRAPVQPSGSNKRHNGNSRFLSRLATQFEPVEPGTFEKLKLPFPEDCRDVDIDKVLRYFNGKGFRIKLLDYGLVSFVGAVRQHALYIWPRLPEPLKPDVHAHFEYELTACHEALVSRVREIRGLMTEERDFSVERKEFDDIRWLTPSVLLEVLSHLDIRTQTGLRRVCPGWTNILESLELTASIVITNPYSNCQTDDAANRTQLHYFLALLIFKCLRQSTQYIVVDGRKGWMNTGDFLKLTEMIHYIGRKTGSRLRTMYLVGLRLELQFGNTLDAEYYEFSYDKCPLHRLSDNAEKSTSAPSPNYRLVDFIAGCGDLPCDAIQLVNCTVELIYAKIHGWLKIQMWLEMPAVRLPLIGDVGSVTWEALEKSTPKRCEETHRMLREWLACVTAKENLDAERGLVCRALCATQSADPRPSSHYRGKEWCVDGLKDLQLSELSAIALDILIDLADYFHQFLKSDDD